MPLAGRLARRRRCSSLAQRAGKRLGVAGRGRGDLRPGVAPALGRRRPRSPAGSRCPDAVARIKRGALRQRRRWRHGRTGRRTDIGRRLGNAGEGRELRIGAGQRAPHRRRRARPDRSCAFLERDCRRRRQQRAGARRKGRRKPGRDREKAGAKRSFPPRSYAMIDGQRKSASDRRAVTGKDDAHERAQAAGYAQDGRQEGLRRRKPRREEAPPRPSPAERRTVQGGQAAAQRRRRQARSRCASIRPPSAPNSAPDRSAVDEPGPRGADRPGRDRRDGPAPGRAARRPCRPIRSTSARP